MDWSSLPCLIDLSLGNCLMTWGPLWDTGSWLPWSSQLYSQWKGHKLPSILLNSASCCPSEVLLHAVRWMLLVLEATTAQIPFEGGMPIFRLSGRVDSGIQFLTYSPSISGGATSKSQSTWKYPLDPSCRGWWWWWHDKPHCQTVAWKPQRPQGGLCESLQQTVQLQLPSVPTYPLETCRHGTYCGFFGKSWPVYWHDCHQWKKAWAMWQESQWQQVEAKHMLVLSS